MSSNSSNQSRAARRRPVIVGHAVTGLEYGYVSQSQEDINRSLETGVLTIQDARHISYWECDYDGGLTSLAVYGPRAGGASLIGAPAPEVTLTEVKTVLYCSADAEAAFAKVHPKKVNRK